MLIISTQQQPDIVAHYQQQWKICPTCWHINEMPVHYCRQCRQGLDGYISYSLQEIGLQWGIRVCPNCLSKYGGSVLTCTQCNGATDLVALNKMMPPPRYSEEISYQCARCQELQNAFCVFCDQCGKMLRFPYTYNTDRPTIPLTLRHANTHIQCNGLVDSGASYNLFHGDLEVILGIDLTNLPTLHFSGIVQGATITGYQASVQLGLLGAFYETVMYFSFDLSLTSPGLLGKVGFFDRFNIELDSANKHVVIRESPILERRVYQRCPQCRTRRASPRSNFCLICGCSLVSPAVSCGLIVPHRQVTPSNLLPPPPA
ncbi:MAG TPA: hypothetical protein VNG51_04610 [Ktedonobacteraceae bacterium]|nr:hypothetical protein [Ktedonobacteraceae bacterium]